jgi:hypothetical protein
MRDTDKPRHIRDIAHLYLSTAKTRPQPVRATVFVAGETKSCFSSFHAANIAAGLTFKDAAVRVFEISSLLPNASFFFAQAPRVYLNTAQRVPGAFSAGMRGVRLCMDPDPWPGSPEDGSRPNLDIVHLPPLSLTEELERVLDRVRDRWVGDKMLLVLRSVGSPANALPEMIVEKLRPIGPYSVVLGRRRETQDSNAAVTSLGGIWNWRRALSDRVPVVIRDPHCNLSRMYLSICESLLCRLNSRRRMSVGTHVEHLSPTAQSE